VSDNSGKGIEPGASFESVRIIKPPAENPPSEPTPVVTPTVDEPNYDEHPDDIPAPSWLMPDAESDGADANAPVGDLVVGEADVAESGVDDAPHEMDTTEIPIVPGSPPEAASFTVAEPTRRKLIVIDDDAPAEIPEPGEKSADAVDPRMRARRREVQRAAGLRRFRVLIAVATVLTLIIGGSILIQSPLFSVKEVKVTGVRYTDAEAVQEVANSLQGQPLYRADLGQAQDAILLQPWVRRVRIVRTWPRTITIDIAERTPVAAVQAEDQNWRVIDVEGRVLALTQGKPIDFIEIKGDPAPVPVGETVSEPMISGARLAEMLPGRLKAITTRVIVGGDGAVALDIAPRGKILLGTIDDLRAKLISVLTYMDACPGVQFDYMDARAAETLVLTPPGCPKSPLTQKPS
jgi:cell division protein FtsQ